MKSDGECPADLTSHKRDAKDNGLLTHMYEIFNLERRRPSNLAHPVTTAVKILIWTWVGSKLIFLANSVTKR